HPNYSELFETFGWHNRVRFGEQTNAGGWPGGGAISNVHRFHFSDSVDYLRAIGDYPPQRWTRQVMLLKAREPGGPDYFLFRDSFDALGDDWPLLYEDWQVFITGIEYGYDIPRAAIERKPSRPLPPAGAAVTLRADRGWQSSGLKLEAGKPYRITADGRYQVQREPEVWWCEPNGVSIRYYQGRPLGQLLAAVRPDDQPADALSPLLRPVVIGLAATLTPSRSGTLMLKTNHSAAELANAAGELNVRVELEEE
ncbi:MAG: hypothetical protein ACOCWL_04340, partial [Thermoguttaceae bacterium]